MEISVYQNSFINKEINLKGYIFIVSIFIIILALVLIFNNNFYDYYKGTASIDINKKISTLVHINDLNKILDSKKIIVEGTTFSYNVDSIDSIDYIYGKDIFKKVYLSFGLTDNLNIINNSFNYDIILKQDTIFNYLLNTIKGE